MYPRILTIPLPFERFSEITLYSFGLMVAIAILTATALTRLELDRMYARGLVGSVRETVKDGRGREKTVQASPSVLVGTMMILAAVFGVLGSKLFHIIDFWDRFVVNPSAFLLSTSGLTFLGGLICASIAIAIYARSKGMNVPRLADAIAPGLLLAYGIGRIGCYLSGDGDWGVCSSLAEKPAWIPGFLWSETFPNNLAGPGQTPIDPVEFNAQERAAECALASPTGVYPTMLYELAICAVLAGVLWALRKHPYKGGWLFSLYLVFAGLERFVIEFIRVNQEVAFGLSQSQLISLAMVIAGGIGAIVLRRRVAEAPLHTATAS